MSYSVPLYVLRPSHGPNPDRHRPRGRALHCVRMRPPPPQRKLHAAPSSTVAAARHGRKTVPCPVSVYVPRTSRRPQPNGRRSQDRVVLCSIYVPRRHVGQSRTVYGPKTVPCSVSVYDPRTSRRPKPNRHLSQYRVVLCSCLRPKTVTSAQAEPSLVPRPCRALFLSTSQDRHVGSSRTVVSPKTMSCSVPVYVPRTVTSAPSRTVTGPKTMSCSVPVYVPRTSRRPKPNSPSVPRPCRALFLFTSQAPSRRPKPNSRRSQDRVVLYSRLRPKNVTSAQAEPSPVPRPCRALFLSTSQDRHVGPSRTVVGPKTVSCSVPVYVPRPSRRPKPNSRRSQDRVVLCSCLRPKNVTSAQAEQSSVPRPCHTLFPSTSQDVTSAQAEQSSVPRPCRALFLSTSQERHVGPSRTVTCPKTVSCSVPVYVPRTSRRPKPNSRRSQDRVVLCSCLRPKNVTSAQAEQSSVPRPCHTLFPSTSRERHVGPSRTVTCPKTVSCSVPVYVPRPSRRPKPNSRRSQDRAILYSRLRPENVTSAQAEPSPVPRPCRALFLSTSRERHVGPSRTVVGPKTVPHSIPVYVPRTSRRPKPNSRRSQDRAMLYSRRPENVTSAEAVPVPRPCHALFLSTSRERHVGPSRAVASPKTVSCSVSVYVPRTCPAQSPVPRQCLALFPSTTRKRHVGPAEQSPVLRPVLLRFRLRPKNVTSAQAE